MGCWNGNCAGYPSCLAKHKDARKNCPNKSKSNKTIESVPKNVTCSPRKTIQKVLDDWDSDILQDINNGRSQRQRVPTWKKR